MDKDIESQLNSLRDEIKLLKQRDRQTKRQLNTALKQIRTLKVKADRASNDIASLKTSVRR